MPYQCFNYISRTKYRVFRTNSFCLSFSQPNRTNEYCIKERKKQKARTFRMRASWPINTISIGGKKYAGIVLEITEIWCNKNYNAKEVSNHKSIYWNMCVRSLFAHFVACLCMCLWLSSDPTKLINFIYILRAVCFMSEMWLNSLNMCADFSWMWCVYPLQILASLYNYNRKECGQDPNKMMSWISPAFLNSNP